MYDAPNAVKELKQSRKHPTKDKVKAITDALVYFELISKKEASAEKSYICLLSDSCFTMES